MATTRLKFQSCDYDCEDTRDKRGTFRVYCHRVDKKCKVQKPAKATKQSWQMTRGEYTGTVGNLYYSPFKDLINIASESGSYAYRAIPKRQQREADKLFNAIHNGDIEYVTKIADKYHQDAFVKGKVSVGPVQVKQPDIIRSRLGSQAHFGLQKLKTHKQDVQQALQTGKPVPPEVRADYPDL